MKPNQLLRAPGPLAALLTLATLAGCNEAANRTTASAAEIGAGCDQTTLCAGELVCDESLPGGFCTLDCDSSNDCPDGTFCRAYDGSAVCVPGCGADTDCRNGYRCVQIVGNDGNSYGVCEPVDGALPDAGGSDAGSLDIGLDTDDDTTVAPGDPNYGAPCADDSTCAADNDLGARCLTDGEGFPDGYCSAQCGDCGPSGACIDTSAGGFCFGLCQAQDDCRGGYTCCAEGDSGICLPDDFAGNCPAPGEEPSGDGFTTPPEPGEIGSGCASDEDCVDGGAPYCFDQVPGGLCTGECETRVDCGDGNWCLQAGAGQNFCVRGCAADSGCPDSQVCCDFGDAAVCVFEQFCR